MTTRLSAGLVACLLVLAGCSSNDGGSGDVSDAAFCAAFDDWNSITFDAGTPMNELMAGISGYADPETLDSLMTADDLQAAAARLLSDAEDLDNLLPSILANISDPGVADTFEQGHNAVLGMMRLVGETARDADSYTGFVEAFLSDFDTFNGLAASFDSLDGDSVDVYVEAACPGLLDDLAGDSGLTADTSAKSDVSTLGKEIAIYFVDWDGVTLPVITIEDGKYYLLGDYIGDVADGNRITGQSIKGDTDWCIEITNDSGNLKVFSYSAQRGLENATCE